MTENEPDPLPSGYCLGRYVIVSELTPAELGRVYKARDTALNRVVAINVLAPTLRNTEGEILLISGLRRALQQANPQAYDYGIAHGIPFVVLEYVEGVGAALDVAKA